MKIRMTPMLVTLVLVASGPALSDRNPATDNVVNLFAYNGTLEKDGAAVSGDVEMKFALYDGAGPSPAPVLVWEEVQTVHVFGGRFTALLGLCESDKPPPANALCVAGDLDAGIAIQDVLQYADDLHLEVVLYPRATTPVTLQHRKRFLPVPYAVWTRSAADMDVARNLVVGGTLTMPNVLTVGVDEDGSGPRTLTFKRNAGDNANTGQITYRPSWAPNTLSIVGAGTTGNVRTVMIHDDLRVQRNIVMSAGGTINAEARGACNCEEYSVRSDLGDPGGTGSPVAMWQSAGDSGAGWYKCNDGRFLQGIYFSGGSGMTTLEQFRCCRPCSLVGN